MVYLKDKRKSGFEYGWCYTDRKDGMEISTRYRTVDYLNDSPYAERVALMLARLGIPHPEDHQIFRGTRHDLLFLDSHGVVIRIGPTDVEDLINPGILQPLGWLEDREHMIGFPGRRYQHKVPLTVAVYPGIELSEKYRKELATAQNAGNLIGLLRDTGAQTIDVDETNCGVLRLKGDQNQDIVVEVLLDADNYFNGAEDYIASKRSSKMREFEKLCSNKSDVIALTLTETFQRAQNVTLWHRAFQQHQPLRNLFWRAFKEASDLTGPVDLKKQNRFWDACAASTRDVGPFKIYNWKPAEDKMTGSNLLRQVTRIPEVSLKTPWANVPVKKPVEPPPVAGKGCSRERFAKCQRAR